MPIYEPDHIEYDITTGFIQIVTDDGVHFRAYDARPTLGGKFPGVALIHDWWGLTGRIRRMANHFAMSGYQVIVPDLFDAITASTAKDAMKLVEALGTEGGKVRVQRVLDVLEHHTRSNHDVAAIGIGLGGGFAFDAAITRTNLEAAVSISGFPQGYLGQFKHCQTPVLAMYGSEEEFIPKSIIKQLDKELADSELKDKHEVFLLYGMKHEIFPENPDEHQREQGREALVHVKKFLDQHIKRPMVTMRDRK